MRRSAVLFDLGGVVLGSPLHAIRDYEAELGLERNAINLVAAKTAPTGAWSRLERGELEMEAFYPAFEADCLAAGIEMDAREMMTRMAASSSPRPMMLEAIRLLREAEFRVGALTNNWAHTGDGDDPDMNDGTRDLVNVIDGFVVERRGCASPTPGSTRSPVNGWTNARGCPDDIAPT